MRKHLKRYGLLITGIIVGAMLATAITAVAANILSAGYNENKVVYNGEELDLDMPLISVVDDSMTGGGFANFMPVRAVLEAMGYEVEWDGATQSVLVTSEVSAPAGVSTDRITVNGRELPPLVDTENKYAGASAQTIAAMALFELLGYNVQWNDAGKTAVITSVVEGLDESEPIRTIIEELVDSGAITDYNDKWGGGIIDITLINGDLEVSFSFSGGDSGVETITVELDGKEAEFDMTIAQGSTFVNKNEFITALREIGFID